MTTLTNEKDVQRKIPASALEGAVLTELEGMILEKVTGPAGNATIQLSKPARALKHVLAHVTADGTWPAAAGTQPNPIEGTHFTFLSKDATAGVATITEAAGTDRSAETWLVLYQPESPEAIQGGASSVTP